MLSKIPKTAFRLDWFNFVPQRKYHTSVVSLNERLKVKGVVEQLRVVCEAVIQVGGPSSGEIHHGHKAR